MRQIRELQITINRCDQHLGKEKSKHPKKSYEEGVSDALRWALGQWVSSEWPFGSKEPRQE